MSKTVREFFMLLAFISGLAGIGFLANIGQVPYAGIFGVILLVFARSAYKVASE